MILANVVPLRDPTILVAPFSIVNRASQPIIGQIWGNGERKELVVVVHGLGGSQQQPQIMTAAEAYVADGYRVITFDATNSFGASGGDISQASLTRHLSDLEDVLDWVRQELRFGGKLIICGFSLGATAALIYQSRNKADVNSVVAIAPVVSGREWLNSFETNRPGSYEILMRTGGFPKHDDLTGRSGIIGREFVDDLLNYDLTQILKKSGSSVTLAVGSDDKTCPPTSIERLARCVGKKATYHVLPDIPHTARKPRELRLLSQFISAQARHEHRPGRLPDVLKIKEN